MTTRTLTPGPIEAIADDIRNHGYAIAQTRIERVPARYRTSRCGQPNGCNQPPTLATFAIAEANFEGDNATRLRFARDEDGDVIALPVCDNHRSEASHVLFYVLTGRYRPNGINAFDALGQHMQWA